MNAYGRVDVYSHIFLISALAGGEWSASRPGRFTPEERDPGTHWIGGWIGPRAGLDDMGNWKFLPPSGLELRGLGRPARSQSLYRLWYSGWLQYILLNTEFTSLWFPFYSCEQVNSFRNERGTNNLTKGHSYYIKRDATGASALKERYRISHNVRRILSFPTRKSERKDFLFWKN
jgi:hypothetical protein